MRLSADIPVKQDQTRLSQLKLSSDIAQRAQINNRMTVNVDELKAVVKTMWLMPRDKFIEMQIEASSGSLALIDRNENLETSGSRLSSINSPMTQSHEVKQTETKETEGSQ